MTLTWTRGTVIAMERGGHFRGGADELYVIESEEKRNQGCYLDLSFEQFVNWDIYPLAKTRHRGKIATGINKSLFCVCFYKDAFIPFKW